MISLPNNFTMDLIYEHITLKLKLKLELHITFVVSDQRSRIRHEYHNNKQDDVTADSVMEKQHYGQTTLRTNNQRKNSCAQLSTRLEETSQRAMIGCFQCCVINWSNKKKNKKTAVYLILTDRKLYVALHRILSCFSTAELYNGILLVFYATGSCLLF